MIKETQNFLIDLENKISKSDDVLPRLRTLTLDDFGELLLTIPNPQLPKISALLPRATPDDVQNKWTGSSGITLLRQSVSFINFVVSNYIEMTGRPFSQANILDFGCGWGRLLRLMLYYIDHKQIHGCDAWDTSLKHITEAQVPGTIRKSEVIPKDLPFPEVNFDLIYAFSIFTHLAEHVADGALDAFRRNIKQNGIIIITIRPVEFWDYYEKTKGIDCSHLIKEHERRGFAYLPGTKEYGDCTMSIDYLRDKFPNWNVIKFGRPLTDPYQLYVCLRPA